MLICRGKVPEVPGVPKVLNVLKVLRGGMDGLKEFSI